MSDATNPSTTGSATSDQGAVPTRTVTLSSSQSVPYSVGSSPLPLSGGASIASLVTSGGLSALAIWKIGETLLPLIKAEAWTQFFWALLGLSIVGAPASALPLLGRLADRFLGPKHP